MLKLMETLLFKLLCMTPGCPILKPLSAKLPPKTETAPHPGWQDGTILEPGVHPLYTWVQRAEEIPVCEVSEV